ncbi:MAG: hypothetical protein SNJ70_11530 [Armatimonadota bacterium]
MQIPEAKQYLGKNVNVTFNDRHGNTHSRNMYVEEVTFVPMYGGYLIGDIDEILLDRVTNISVIE